MLDLEQAKQELAKAPARDPSSRAERLRLLLLHSKEFYRQHPKQAEKWAGEALTLATKLKDAEGVARAHYTIGATAFQQAQYPLAEVSFKKAIDMDRVSFQNPLYESPIFSLGLVYAQQGNFREAFELYEKSLALCRKQGRDSEVSILTAMGNAAIELADYPRALNYLYGALAILDEKDDPLRRSVVLTNIAGLYLEIQDLEKADTLFHRAAGIKRELGDAYGLFDVLHNRGIIADKRGDKQAARSLFSEALVEARSVNREDAESYVLFSLGQLELERDRPGEAVRLLLKSAELARSLDLKMVWCSSSLALGKAYLRLDNAAAALKALKESVKIASESGMEKLEWEGWGALARANERAGKLQDAIFAFNRFSELNARIHSEERQRAVVEVQTRVEIEKADRERERMEAIARTANERADLLRAETERQSRELTTLALQLVEKNEFLCSLKESIEPNLKSSRKAKEIAGRIDDHIRSDRDWETFENQFDLVHAGFLRELSARYPTLTPMELKVAVLIRLQLPTKAMASLLCLSLRTIENHRQRLRKKLRLAQEENLATFLVALGESVQ